MNLELRRIDPLRSANVAAILYGLLLTVFSLIAFPFFLLAAFISPDETGFIGPLMAVFVLILYPIFGALMGWISGILTAAIYNFVIRWSGGLLFEFDDVSPASSSGGTSPVQPT